MKKRMIALVLLAALILPILVACGNDSAFITPDKAQKIALKANGYRESQVEAIHAHGGQYNAEQVYSIHITVGGVDHEVIVRATDGEVLNSSIVEADH